MPSVFLNRFTYKSIRLQEIPWIFLDFYGIYMVIWVRMDAKTRYSVETEKWLARNGNEPFWQWFWARSQKCFKTALWRFQKLGVQKLIRLFGGSA